MSHTIVLPAFVPGRSAADVDASLRQALAARDRAHECAVLWFAEVRRRGLFRELGHPSLEVYAEQALGFTSNRTWQFKRLADDLDRLPELREAVATGAIGWTKAQQVARVATPATQSAWIAKAATTGRRELAREVQAQLPPRRSAASHQIEMTAGLVPAQGGCRDAVDARAAGDGVAPGGGATSTEPVVPPRDGTATAGFAAQVPVAAVAPAQGSVSLRGDALQLARFDALIEKVRKSRRLPAAADRLDLVLAGLQALLEEGECPAAEPAAPVPARRAGPVAQVIVHQCPDCAAAVVTTARGELPLAPAQAAAVRCDARVREPGRPNRATIPPAVRAGVLARDRHRCTTSGCGATMFLEVHHVVPRHRGGSNRAENLVTLCSRCHTFTHEREGAGAVVGVAGGA